jgi:hypothetical protein
MSANQTACRITGYHKLLNWFANQPELAPVNVCHFNILQSIMQFLVANSDLWATPDAKAMCIMGDSIVAMYDQPMDVVDLTREEHGVDREDAGEPEIDVEELEELLGNEATEPNLPAEGGDDSGVA